MFIWGQHSKIDTLHSRGVETSNNAMYVSSTDIILKGKLVSTVVK